MGINNETVEVLVSSKTSSNGPIYAISAVVIALAFLITRNWRSSTLDSREPKVIYPKIPIIGHAVGMLLHQAEYLAGLSTRVQLPIFSIRILGGQLYVINSPELTQGIFRHSKAFSFDPIATFGSKKILSLDQRQLEILARPIDGIKDVEFPLATAVNRAMHKILAPGPNSQILIMNARALNRFADFLNPIGRDGIQVNMYEWFQETFTVATSVGLYGKDSPIDAERSLVKHLTHFEEALGLLILDKAPSITARKGHIARQVFAEAFKEYYRKGCDAGTSGLITARRDCLEGGGYNTDDIAQFDIAINVAASMNSNPALFWLVCLIYSDPSVLAEIRAEIASAVSVNGDEAIVDISQLMKDCPLLVSSMQEMLRIMDATVSFRIVMEDHLLNDTYLLRKGGVVQIICSFMHTSPHIWGADSQTFDARRFLKSTQDSLSRDTRKKQRDGFTPFGGGTSLCPGRHFVTMEILGVVATLLVGYDISMKDGSQLKMPKPKKQAFGVQVRHIEKDIPVVIRRKEDWIGKTWRYDLGTGENAGTSNLAFDTA